jgi:hypothetical protein
MAGNSAQQRRFWNELTHLRVHAYYLNEYYEKSNKYDRIISSFLALASSSSIAGWVIWNQIGFIWAFIIAISQAIHAIKQYLPFKKRMASLSKLMDLMDRLYIFAESRWYEVSEGKLSDEEINKLITKIKMAKCRYTNKIMNDCSLPTDKYLLTVAEQMTYDYFSSFQGEEHV